MKFVYSTLNHWSIFSNSCCEISLLFQVLIYKGQCSCNFSDHAASSRLLGCFCFFFLYPWRQDTGVSFLQSLFYEVDIRAFQRCREERNSKNTFNQALNSHFPFMKEKGKDEAILQNPGYQSLIHI